MKKIIAVIGGCTCTQEIYDIAVEVGKYIAKSGNILICGGLGGVMEAACKGAKSENGLTIGVLPGINKDSANFYVDIPIVTGMSIARNVIIIRSSDAVIAINGEYGTLSELAIAGNLGTPVVCIKTWDVGLGIKEDDPKKAVELAIKLASGKD